MKKIFTVLYLIAISILVNAQDFNDVKICINPGHGGHDSNDRFIQETGFWESDGNLDKGLFVRDLLQGFNAAVIMTRTTNTTADDLPLSQIVAIANANNVDYFHSIHSNAYNAQSNYTLLLYQGRTAAPTYPNSAVMANYVVNEIYQAHRTTSKSVAGDFDFYGTGKPYLGVFKGLNMPGTLSEGSFHDYIPESWRLRNLAYKKHEAWAIVKAFISYYNLNPIQTGMIAGIVRDPEQKVSYYGIASKGDDIMPLNNIKVTLQPGNIVYNGDSYNNGFFLFDSLAPGQYKLIYECENYFKDSSIVNVEANKTVFADKYLQYDTTIAPIAVSHFPVDSPDSIKTSTVIKVSFNRIMNRQTVENSFTISPNVQGTFTWEDGDKTVVFTPTIPLNKAANYQVSVSTSAKSKWNVSIQSSYSFTFITKNRNRLALEKFYPDNNQTNISRTVQIRLTFDAVVNAGSLANQINLYNSSNVKISVKNAKVFSENRKGLIYFEPAVPLNPNSNYKIILGGGIADMDNIPLVEQKEINFKTELELNVTGTIMDDFESLSGYQISIVNADTTLTKLT
ncbi:MAG: N-acetylmuramoyl-L-alanine amidase, partial [Bacteroidetes bacterium]|nr:N-acetylmuramoyl-L-alanine amidase [Bacteroidota bacterium]